MVSLENLVVHKTSVKLPRYFTDAYRNIHGCTSIHALVLFIGISEWQLFQHLILWSAGYIFGECSLNCLLGPEQGTCTQQDQPG